MDLIKMTREWYMAKGKAFPEYVKELWELKSWGGQSKKDAEIVRLGEEFRAAQLENVALKAKFMALTHHASMAGSSGLALLREMDELKAHVEAWNLTKEIGDLPPDWANNWVHRDRHDKVLRDLEEERDRAIRLDRLISSGHDRWEEVFQKIDPRTIS